MIVKPDLLKTAFSAVVTSTETEFAWPTARTPGVAAVLDRRSDLVGGGTVATTLDLSAAWAHLLGRLKAAERLVGSGPVNRNRVDYASGMRHLLVFPAVGIDEALRVDPDPVLAVGADKHERHPDLGHGMSRLHLPTRHTARR